MYRCLTIALSIRVYIQVPISHTVIVKRMAPPRKPSRKTAVAPLRKTIATAARKSAQASGGVNMVAVRKTVSVKKSTEILHIHKPAPQQNKKKNKRTAKKATPKKKPTKASGPIVAIAVAAVNTQ